jgi:thiamine-monophosphate kinase
MEKMTQKAPDEFEFLRGITAKYGLTKIGDDCAILPKDGDSDLVITADLLVQNIDFKLEWTSAEMLGHKALAVSLSDIAATGASSRYALLSIAVSQGFWASDLLDGFYEGWHKLAKIHGVELVGGDLSRIDEGLVIDSVVIGEVPKGKAVRRSGAKPGDGIYVSDNLGSAAAGLRLLERGYRMSETTDRKVADLLKAQLAPVPRADLGVRLREADLATSMVDLSDGLSSDLAHICDASGVGARIFADRIPIGPELGSLFTDSDELLALALNGGEDFELLFTASSEKKSSPELDGLFNIGEITANVGVIEIISDKGAEVLPRKGYRHF